MKILKIFFTQAYSTKQPLENFTSFFVPLTVYIKHVLHVTHHSP